MSIQIGRHIQSVLRADSQVKAACKNRIYPVVIPMSAPAYPFIVHTITNTAAEGTKDGNASDTASVNLVIVHKDYDQGITLANHVRYLLEGEPASYDYMEVQDCVMLGFSEDFDVDLQAFVFVLNFNFNTIDL